MGLLQDRINKNKGTGTPPAQNQTSAAQRLRNAQSLQQSPVQDTPPIPPQTPPVYQPPTAPQQVYQPTPATPSYQAPQQPQVQPQSFTASTPAAQTPSTYPSAPVYQPMQPQGPESAMPQQILPSESAPLTQQNESVQPAMNVPQQPPINPVTYEAAPELSQNAFSQSPSMLQDKFQTRRNDQQLIQDKIDSEILTPTAQEQEIIDQIQRKVAEKFRDKISKGGIDKTVEKGIKELIHAAAQQHKLSFETEKRVEKIVLHKLLGLGAIESFRLDPEITEIIVERYDRICIERNGTVYETNAKFTSEEELLSVINRIIAPTGRTINISMPMVDSRLADGSRVNATIPPVTPDGATLTIRKFPNKMLTGQDYLDKDSLSPAMLTFLQSCVAGKLALMVSGGTGAGKTSLLNMLSQFIPNNELIVTIEDSLELKLQQPHVRRMEARVTANNEFNSILMPVTPQTMVKNALRMRPDRIIIGEVRDGTIVDMLTAASTGHDGTMSTIHANSPENLVDSRLPILFSMNKDAHFTEKTQKLLFSESIDLIVQINRMPDHSRKITKITHVTTNKKNELILQDIFVYSLHKKAYMPTEYVPTQLIGKMKSRGITIDTGIFKKGV